MKVSYKFLTAVAVAALMVLPAVASAENSHSTVNKSIRIGSDTSADDVDSVNGSIRIGANSSVSSVESVNGSIKLANDVTVDKDIDAVNGGITLGSGCEVGGDVETVNGGIHMQGTLVSGNVETINGGIQILDGSEIAGNVKVEKPHGWSWNNRNKPVHVEIGKDVVVHGDLIFEHAVELELHETARVGEIIGDEVEMVGNS
jgi:DUF4097 and DUF4098 domain-containing protein YvlB